MKQAKKETEAVILIVHANDQSKAVCCRVLGEQIDWASSSAPASLVHRGAVA